MLTRFYSIKNHLLILHIILAIFVEIARQ